MLGYLVPCSGGKSIALVRSSLFLGRRSDADREAPLNAQTALCRLRFVNGWWHVDDLLRRGDVRINHERCDTRRLNRMDELAIGRAHFPIDYVPPQDAAELLEQIAESVLFDDSSSPPNTHVPTAPAAVATAPANESSQVTHANLAALEQTAPQKAITAGTSELRTLLGRLVPLGGGPDHPLMKSQITVGRQPPCDVVLRTGTVSSKHCSLELIEGYWQVKDLGSRNGVRLDSVRCDQAWVFPESRLSIADQRFRLDYEPEGEPPVPHPSQRRSLLDQAGLTGDKLERLMTRTSQQAGDSEKKRWELLEEV